MSTRCSLDGIFAHAKFREEEKKEVWNPELSFGLELYFTYTDPLNVESMNRFHVCALDFGDRCFPLPRPAGLLQFIYLFLSMHQSPEERFAAFCLLFLT